MVNGSKSQGIELQDRDGKIHQFKDTPDSAVDHDSPTEKSGSENARKTSWIITALSILCTSICTILSIYTCYGVIVEFLGDPISMETTLKQETDGTRMFPDVIICLRHIQNRSQGVTLAAAMKEAEARFSQSLEISKIQINNKESGVSAVNDYYRKLLWSKSQSEQIGYSIAGDFATIRKEEFIIDCELRKANLRQEFIDCSPYFELFTADDFSNCRMLNLPSELRVAISAVRGRIGGVKINVFLNKSKSSLEKDVIASKDGVRVTLSDKSFQTTPEDHGGIDVEAGTDESISFAREETLKMSRSGRGSNQQFSCASGRDWSDYQSLTKGLSGLDIFTSKQVQCQHACQSLYTHESCGCVTSRYYGPSYCVPTVNQSICLEKNSDTLVSRVRECVDKKCQPLCRTVEFQVSTSEGEFPTDSFMPVFLANLLANTSRVNPDIKKSVEKLLEDYGSSTDFSKLRQNFVHIHVYSDTYATIYNDEASVYTVWSLISNIGGNLGLFLGWSFIGLFQMSLDFGKWLKKHRLCSRRCFK